MPDGLELGWFWAKAFPSVQWSYCLGGNGVRDGGNGVKTQCQSWLLAWCNGICYFDRVWDQAPKGEPKSYTNYCFSWHDGAHCLFWRTKSWGPDISVWGVLFSQLAVWPYMGLGPELEDFKWLLLQCRVNCTFSWCDGFLCHGRGVNQSRMVWNWCPVQDKGIAGLVLLIWSECQVMLSFCLLWWDWKQAWLYILQSLGFLQFLDKQSVFQINLEFCLSGARPQFHEAPM